jgi:NTP pyrophosphatase (non-canonical NTP hydrolase)
MLALATWGLGVSGEAGEVSDLIKKHIGHSAPLDRDKLLLELGDVLWYVSAIAQHCGLTLEQVAKANEDKLARRFPGGVFTPQAAAAKADEHTP